MKSKFEEKKTQNRNSKCMENITNCKLILNANPIVIEIIVRASHSKQCTKNDGIEWMLDLTKFRIICSQNNIWSRLAIEERMTLNRFQSEIN